MTEFNWAIVGPGKIAHRFANAVHALPQANLIAVCGRDSARASAFVAQHDSYRAMHPVLGCAVPPCPIKACVDLKDLLSDPHVHAIYVATPHAQHGDIVRQCLLAGKPVLCEKPLVPTAALARELVAISQQKRVFLMEALWTRFLPIYSVVGQWVRSGIIGSIRQVNSSFCFNAPFSVDTVNTRLYAPELAGGALLDIGIYNLSLTRWALSQATGRVPERRSCAANGVLAPSGVDQRVQAQMSFVDSISGDTIGAQMICALDASAPNHLHILGSLGYIEVSDRFWESTRAVMHRPGLPAVFEERRFDVNGFEYEIRAAMAAIRAGQIECAEIDHAETVETLEWLDELRIQVGVKYPFE